MKEFIQNNKWLITTIIAVLAQIANIAGLPTWLTLTIQILTVTLTVLQARVEAVNETNEAEYNASRYGLKAANNKPFIRITIHKMIWDLILKIPTDFKRENITKKENIPSHLLIGGGILFLIMPTSLPLWFKYTFASFAAIGIGMFIEIIQKYWFDGTPNERDVRWGWYGYFLFIPLAMFFESIGSRDYLDYINSGILFSTAFLLHYLNRK